MTPTPYPNPAQAPAVFKPLKPLKPEIPDILPAQKRTPRLPELGGWLAGWVQPEGAIFGFHNHSVWGDNPFRYGDFTAGHSTFASPMLPALALALKQQPDHRGADLLERLVRFQTSSLQADGQFAHVGFQCGEMLKRGLIHNVVPCAALSAVAGMSDVLRGEIDQAVRGVLAATDRLHGKEPGEKSCANQEYCRLWARLLHMAAFDHREWHDSVAAGLDFMIERFHVRGQPDDKCVGTWRVLSDRTILEPAEYYGLMIHPLLMGFQRYGTARYLQEALAIARHCARSGWVDGRGRLRAHRLWAKAGGCWHRIQEPMLIGGFGITLSAMQALINLQADAEIERFLIGMDATYAASQSPAGFFLAATGWGSEPDIIPSTAWQSHDLFHLVVRHGVGADFWDTLFTPSRSVDAVFGQSMVWLEDDVHWAVRGYHTANGLNLVGRKDRATFAVDIPAWIGRGRESDPTLLMPDEPKFLRMDSGIIQIAGRRDVRILRA